MYCVINPKTLEAIWQEAKLGLWSSECISVISNKYNIYPTNTKNFIDFYFKNILKYEKSKIQLFKKCYLKFRLFLEYKLENEKDFNQALEYYKIFANAEEKTKFKNTSLEILNKILELSENEIPTYLKSLNLSIYNLYLLAILFRPDLEIKIAKLFKEYYDFCDNNSWKAPILKEKAQNLNIPYKIFLEMAKIYALKVLGISDIENVIINSQNKDLRSKFAKAPILQRIYESENEEEFLTLFYNNKIEQEDIFRFCYTYHRELPQNIKNKMEKNLLEKYKIYIKKKQFTPNTAKYTRAMIEDFLNSPDFIEEYCLSHSYNSKGLASAIKNSKDEELKKRYEEKKKREKEIKNSYIESTVLNIINFIENGFISDNNVYPFELIDFYILFFGVSIKQLKTGSLSKDKAAILRSFFLPLENATVLSKNSIVNAHISKAIYINGIKYLKTFTQDELIEIINFMDYYNIPFNDLLFHQVCIRYATNTLSIYNTKDFALK